jgi:hypothetical protein
MRSPFRVTLLAALVLAAFVLPSLVEVVTDWWWFDELGHQATYATVLGAQATLGGLAFVVSLAWLTAHLRIAARTLPGVGAKGAYFVRGSGHDKHAGYTEDSDAYKEVVDRLRQKFAHAATLVPKPAFTLQEGADVACGRKQQAGGDAGSPQPTSHGTPADGSVLLHIVEPR